MHTNRMGKSNRTFVHTIVFLSSAIIIYYCLSNIWALIEPQIRNDLIINNFNFLHRQVNLHTNDKMIYHRLS